MKINKPYWMIPLIAIKSLFEAFIQVCWGLVTLAALGWAVFYLKREFPQQFTNITFPSYIGIASQFIMDNVGLLIILISIVYFYFEYNKLNKKEKLK